MWSRAVPSRLVPAAFSASRRSFASSRPRLNVSNKPSSFAEGLARYKLFVGPFSKVFLGAIFTYQVLYWSWLKLEMDESKLEKNQEVAELEKKARELTSSKN
ncbi:hypothetical protein P170DRAFT_439973 [Aspergillus steynii IBT 23096]|uniref:Uncharacterized protein n=1 Tax=Aspergillus steynii IBT 23096 TaxID=1392250 RepID=A0A2I2FVQ3_9EURO|nr:uncharacterized protein P170DRAFT_439973 [Aspergillus steynii IBT 23096]PLB44723.1 hypothetical protein P170DRAFT_439973 [Aspergillus steynii IBT 23096]